MGCLPCFGGRKSARVAPDERSSSTAPVGNQHPQAATLSHADTLNSSEIDNLLRKISGNGHKLHGSVIQDCAKFIDDILSSILVAAKLAVPSTGSTGQQKATATAAAQVPKDVAALQRQLSTAVGATGPGRTGALSQLADYLLAFCKQQQSQWPAAGAAADCWVPSADVLVNTLNILLFAQVTLDTATTLHSRYEQCSNALGVIGLQVSTLSAIVQAASKAILAYLMLGKEAQAGELKVSLIVRRNTAFWDALQQLQQQEIVPASVDQQQQVGKRQLAKLFPRFVDESLGLQQKQQLMHQDSSGLGNAKQWRGSSRRSDSTDPVADTVESGEGHGPRKEFFGLVGENWTKSGQDQQPALLVHIRAAGTWWCNTVLQQTPQLEAAYWAVGWLLGQAIINRSTMGVQLAPLLFHRLLQPDNGCKATLAVLEQHDSDAAQGLSAVLKMPQQQYQELLQVEEQPSSLSRQAYVDQAVQQLLVHDVDWQYQALRQGFYTVVDRQVLLDCCFDGYSLAAAICGPAADTANADFDIRQVFRVVLEDEDASNSLGQTTAGAAGNEPVQQSKGVSGQGAASEVSTVGLTVQCLWEVLDGWSPQQKRALVKFVTGSDRLPPVGSEQLTLSFPFVVYGIKQHQQLLGTLPQSHTCANTLELPNYAEALTLTDHQLALEWRDAVGMMKQHKSSSSKPQFPQTCPNLVDRCRTVLEERLSIAVTSCQSYGLDEASTSTGVHAGQMAPMAAAEQPLIPRPIPATGHWQGNSSLVKSLSSSKDNGDGPSTIGPQGVLAAKATAVRNSSTGVVGHGVPDTIQINGSSRAGAYASRSTTHGRQDLGDVLFMTPDDTLSTSIGQQDPIALQQQQQRQPRSHELVAKKQQPVGNPKLLTESDEDFLDEILEGGMLRL